jgi:ABC-type transporter Mla MlaB component
MNMNLTVEKKLTIYEVTEIQKKILTLLESDSHLQMDLSQVTECDTAGIQLLCSILFTSQKENRKITINTFSRTIQNTAKTIGVQLTTEKLKPM